MAGTSAGMGPLISAWITTVFPSAGIISITFTRKFGTAFGNARQMRSMPPRIGITLSRPYGAYRPIASPAQRATMPSTSWASYAVKNFSAIGRNFAVFVFISVPFGVAFVVVLCGLVFKPLAERLHLFLRVGREQMFDCHVRRRDENRFRVRESIKTGLTVVMADAGVSNTPKRHGLDKQVDVHLIDGSAAEG